MLKMLKTYERTVNIAVQSAQLAMILEVSAYPKPGNVHRTADFKDTKYEHFLASAVAVLPQLQKAATMGIKVALTEIKPSQVGIGALIKGGIVETSRWQRGGNTNLGILTLIIPLVTATTYTFVKDKDFKKLRGNIKSFIESTTSIDAVNFYEAIKIAKPGGLGKTDYLDVTDPDSIKQIMMQKVSLYEIFEKASNYDNIAGEWITSYNITFEIGYPYLQGVYKETGDVNIAIIHTFLKILSAIPDTLIIRKTNLATAQKISEKAKQILDMGGLTTKRGAKLLWEFDKMLREKGNKLNPGTTADLTTSSLMVAILNGFKP